MPASILHVLGSAEPEGASIARIVAGLAAGLDPAKYHVHAWFLGPPGPLVKELQAAGATASCINWQRGARDPVGAFRFWRCLQKHDFAIVHQHFGSRSIRQLIFLSSHARLVVHFHGYVAEPSTARSVPVAVHGADMVIAASRAIALELPALKPVVVYAGVEPLKQILPINKVSRKTIVIGTACRLVPLKGLAHLIRAMALLNSDFNSLRLEIAGDGPQRDDLESQVSRLDLKGQVRFLGWQRDLGSNLREWDIFAMPSLAEGFPIVALEAMAEGLPVVATSVGGLPELIEDSKTGYLVPPSDAAALAARLRLLILDPQLRQAMGAAGQERVRARFSVSQTVAEIEAIYDSLILAGPA